MKPKFFTKTFKGFFVGFLCIIGLAFAVMIGAANLAPSPTVDNVAAPQ